MNPLRWGVLPAAALAGVLANLAGFLYLSFDPRTAWGPYAYIIGGWATAALACTAWAPTRWAFPGLLLGAAASLAWFVYMVQFGFVLNLAGHFLAAVFFAVAAWVDRPTKSTS